jgi:hypothetical protein
VLVHSAVDGPLAIGPRGVRYLADGRVEGEDPLGAFSPTAAQHLLRTDGFTHVGDIMVGSFYDPELEQGCAFEELISFHGGLGGPQTRAFILHPVSLPVPDEPIIGAAHVNELLRGWRASLQMPRVQIGAPIRPPDVAYGLETGIKARIEAYGRSGQGPPATRSSVDDPYGE